MLWTCASTKRSPTSRAIASASSQRTRASSERPFSISACASAATTRARSGVGGRGGTSRTASRQASSPSACAALSHSARPVEQLQQRDADRLLLGVELGDRLPRERDGALGIVAADRDLGRPPQQRGVVEAGTLGGVGDLPPQRERALAVALGLEEGEGGGRLRRRLHRRGQRERKVPRRLPMVGQLAGDADPAGRQLRARVERPRQRGVEVAALLPASRSR